MIQVGRLIFFFCNGPTQRDKPVRVQLFSNRIVRRAVLWHDALVRAVVPHVGLLAHAARLAVGVARPQVVARVVAGHLGAAAEARLVHLVRPVACYNQYRYHHQLTHACILKGSRKSIRNVKFTFRGQF